MKPKYISFPLKLVLTSSAVMAVLAPLDTFAVDYTWGGSVDSDWTNNANWTTGTAPTYGTDYSTADTLRISNGLSSGAVYNPSTPLNTKFGGTGRAFVLGSTTAGNLTISNGTLSFIRANNGGSEPIMANGANASLLINGGALDLTAHSNTFLFMNGGAGNTSNLTITSGSFASNGFNFQTTGTGTGTVNLDGGSMAVTLFTRPAGASGSTVFNLDGGILQARGASGSFLPALTGLQTIVEDGGAIIDTNGFGITIAEVLEHDATLGPALDGGLVKNGVGSLTLSGASTFTGPVTVNAGTSASTTSRIALGNNTGAGTGTITLANSFTEIQVNNTRNIANPVIISNTGDTKEILLPSPGGGAFAGATFSGPITINENSSIDNFRVRSDDNCFLTFSGVVSGPGGIFKFQPGRLNLTNGSNSFTGDIKITHGEVSFTNGALGTSGRIRMEGSGTVGGVSLRWDPTNDQDVSSRIDMFAGKNAQFNLAEQTTPTFATANVTFANAIGNGTTASITKTGPGTLTLTQPSTYSGGSTLTQGTLEFPLNGLGTTGSVTMNGGILRWATGNTQDLSSRIVMVNGRNASFSTNGNDISFANAIGNSTTAGLTKTSTSGTLTLNGASSYSGATTVGGGTLKLAGGANLGVAGLQTTSVIGTTVASGATLDLNGSTVNEVITASGTGVGDDGALANNSPSPAIIGNQITGFTLPALGTGSGFSIPPAVTLTGGGGSGATATASLGVTNATFEASEGDRTYSAAPTITISGGGGSGATATAVLSGTGTLSGIVITNAGSGYTTAPTVALSGGTVLAAGTSVTTFAGNADNFTVGGLTLTNPGSGYTSAPTVNLNGSPATATTHFSSVILAANTSIGGTGNTTINGVVSQSGGSRNLTKVGAGTVTLNAANTYTGETIVNDGTLAINTDDTLADAAAVRIDSAAVLNLGFTGTDTVDRIFIGGVEQVSGTWGSLASSATNKTPRITGTGILQVTNGTAPSNPYATWSGGATFGGDANNDGVTNGMAFLLGASSPTVNANGLLPAPSQSGGNLTLTFSMRDSAARGTASLEVQHSSDLGITDPWSAAVVVPDVSGTSGGITFAVSGTSPIINITATIPASGNAAGGKLFGRAVAKP